MKRKLSENFMLDLTCQAGILNGLLNYVKCDNTLDFEIRESYANIYYRGGNALKVTEKAIHQYDFHFDIKYLKVAPFLNKEIITTFMLNAEWGSYFPLAKQAMDFYFTDDCKEEREFQQLVVRENNYSTFANATDYFIIDIEYNNHKNARFDMVAVEWKSNATERKLMNECKPRLVIIEMKYGDGALTGSSGINKHILDFKDFIAKTEDVNAFKEEMLGVFAQKRQLGLIPCLSDNGNKNPIIQFADELEMLFLLANHDPASSILKSALSGIQSEHVRFIASNFTGYGLFKENIFTYNEFIERFQYGIFNEI